MLEYLDLSMPCDTKVTRKLSGDVKIHTVLCILSGTVWRTDTLVLRGISDQYSTGIRVRRTMAHFTFLCVVLAVLASMCKSDVPEDEIKYLPGLLKQPFFKQYSGYLKASGTKKLHYWFIQSQSDNPMIDPVVLWLNGGPGCSSDLGLLTENGPFWVQPDGATLEYNPYSWNKIANMLYLEAPAGVGFSYSDDKNYTTGDDEVALDNHLALKDFFSKYSEYVNNDFYVTGESYGGVYVPTLASRLVDDSSFNLKGIAVGNGITDFDLNDNSLIYFGYFHGLIGPDLWKNLVNTCCSGNSTNCTFTHSTDKDCGSWLEQAEAIIEGGGLNIYNLYAECLTGSGIRINEKEKKIVSSSIPWLFAKSPRKQKQRMLLRLLGSDRLTDTPPCINATAIITYLNNAAVRQALHIPDIVQPWTPCSTEVGNNYQIEYETMFAVYVKLLNAKLRVLVYNGDVDMACNFLGDEWFVNSLNLKQVSARKEWFYTAEDGTQQIAGFAQAYENLTFVTVRGSGHMVPTDRPGPALILFTNLIKNQPF